jgi:hypothetical protein
LTITRRSLSTTHPPVQITMPDGVQRQIRLKETDNGRASAQIRVDDPGIYRVTDGSHQALAVFGDLNSIEFANVHATASVLQPVTRQSGGGLFWLADGTPGSAGVPGLRRVKPDRLQSGSNWIGLRANGASRVTGVATVPLLPGSVALLLLAAFLGLAWWREGH